MTYACLPVALGCQSPPNVPPEHKPLTKHWKTTLKRLQPSSAPFHYANQLVCQLRQGLESAKARLCSINCKLDCRRQCRVTETCAM